jgi:hypothetical protein
LDQLKRARPELANDPEAYLFGVTDEDMYTIWADWRYTFTQRDGRRAVLSSARMEPDLSERLALVLHRPSAPRLDVQAKMRRILLKDVAVLFWHLPLNNDPHSVLSQAMDPD